MADRNYEILLMSPASARVGIVSSKIIDANVYRSRVTIINLSSNPVYLSFGDNPAVVNAGIMVSPNGGELLMDAITSTTECINAISLGDSLLAVQEFINSSLAGGGQSAYETAVASGFVGDESTWLLSLKGPKGDNGDTGAASTIPGTPGPQGDTGPQGDIGPQGLKGDPGLPGYDGAKGDTGDVGPRGLQGLPGNDGSQGLQGLKGDKGDAGSRGIQGLKGDQGDQGPPGMASTVPGPQGLQGIPGLQGSKGDTGEQGLQGIQGVKGDTGDVGQQGIQGIQGIQGPAGSGVPVYAALSTGTTAMAFGTNTAVKVTPNAGATYTTTVPAAGNMRTLIILTSGTSSYTITFGSGFKPTATLATGTSNNRVFVIHWISDGVNLYESGRTAAMTA